jgi:long-subunit fatty acid transport protein
MKNIKIIIASVLILMLSYLPAAAQNAPLNLDLNYNYSFPASHFKNDLVSDGSPRGFAASLLYPVNSNWAVGLALGFQDYYQKYPRATYQLSKTQDISAVLTNSIQTAPILAKVKYYPALQSSFLKPYLSLAAGGNVIDYNQYFGEFGNSHSNFGFRAEGGLGLFVPFKNMGTSGINVGANYAYSPYKKFGLTDLNSFNVQAGIQFHLR